MHHFWDFSIFFPINKWRGQEFRKQLEIDDYPRIAQAISHKKKTKDKDY
jgi:hypothetical protein